MSEEKTNTNQKYLASVKVKESLEWLRDLQKNISTSNGVNKNTVISLESHYSEVSELVGPVNGFTMLPSAVGQPTIEKFVKDKLLVEAAAMKRSMIESIDLILADLGNETNRAEELALITFLKDNFSFNGDVIPQDNNSKVLEILTTDADVQEIISSIANDVVVNCKVLEDNTQLLTGKLIETTGADERTMRKYPITSSEKVASFSANHPNDMYLSRTNPRHVGEVFWDFIWCLETFKNEKNAVELPSDKARDALLKLTTLLAYPFTDGTVNALNSFKRMIAAVAETYVDGETVLEVHHTDIWDIIGMYSDLYGCRRKIYKLLKLCMTPIVVEEPRSINDILDADQ